LAGLALLAACGGGGPTTDSASDDGTGPPQPVLASVSLSPATFTVVVGGTQQFTAAAFDSSGAPFSPVTYAWGAQGGTVSTSGLFTAGATAGSARVWVTANNQVSDTSTGTIDPLPAAAGDTVMKEDFEASSTVNNLVWTDRGFAARQTIDSSTGAARTGQKALRIEYPQGSDGGWLTHTFPPGWDTIYVSYWVKLQSGWLGGTKLISFYGGLTTNPLSAAGKASQCPDGTQWFVATTIAEQFQGPSGPTGPTRFYTYYPDMQPDASGACYGSPGPPGTYVQPTVLSAGAWHLIEFEVILNTPGQLNASQQLWVDDVLVGSWSGFRFRETTDLRLNAVTISASLSGGAAQTQYMWVDDLVVLRRRP
jgi:hypothetical protein